MFNWFELVELMNKRVENLGLSFDKEPRYIL